MEDPNKFQVLSAEAVPRFQEGISLVLSKWWALQMAIQNSYGASRSRSHDNSFDFPSRIFNFFHQHTSKDSIYIDDLEDLLVEGMDSLNTDVHDGSIEEVAEKLMIMYEECLEGDYQSILKLQQVKSHPVPRVQQDANDSDEDEDEDEDEDDENMVNDGASYMMVDAPESLANANPIEIQKNDSRPKQMIEAEDGWTLVPPRKSRGRKN